MIQTCGRSSRARGERPRRQDRVVGHDHVDAPARSLPEKTGRLARLQASGPAPGRASASCPGAPSSAAAETGREGCVAPRRPARPGCPSGARHAAGCREPAGHRSARAWREPPRSSGADRPRRPPASSMGRDPATGSPERARTGDAWRSCVRCKTLRSRWSAGARALDAQEPGLPPLRAMTRPPPEPCPSASSTRSTTSCSTRSRPSGPPGAEPGHAVRPPFVLDELVSIGPPPKRAGSCSSITRITSVSRNVMPPAVSFS